MSSGSASAITVSMPSSAATARGRGLAVAGEQDRLEPLGAQPARWPRGSRPERVGHRRAPRAAAPSKAAATARPSGRPARGDRARRASASGRAPCSASERRPADDDGRPSTTRLRRPGPRDSVKRSTAGSGAAARRSAAAAMARPIGCSEACSTAPTSRSASARSTPSTVRRRASVIRPLVTVPVLSRTTVSIRRVDSSDLGPLIRIPSWAPRPVPTSSAVGVARPSAHGHATTSTATVAGTRTSRPAPPAEPVPSVATRDRRAPPGRTRRRPGRRGAAPAPCRSGPRPRAGRSGRARCRPDPPGPTTSRPPTLIDAPTTSSPCPTSTGTLSPVSSDSSTAERPAIDDAVGGDLLARADDEAVADLSSSIGTSRSTPSVPEDRRLLGAELWPGRAGRRPRGASPEPRSSGRRAGTRPRPRPPRGRSGSSSRTRRQELERHLHAGLACVEEEERDDRPAPGGERAEGDQGVHRRRPVPQVLPGREVEGPARPENDRGRRAAVTSHCQ